MSEAVQPSRLIVTQDSRLRLPRHIKFRHDEGRGKWLVLAPERVFEPDEIAVEVLKQCDGERTVKEIAAILAADYQAPVDVILNDIIAMLQELTDKGVLKS